MGNESGGGPNFEAAYQAAREIDARFIHYEGMNDVADMDSRMYPSIESMIAQDNEPRNKPFFYVSMHMPWEMLSVTWKNIGTILPISLNA